MVYANENDSITYSFYNPTRRTSFVVSGQLVEDVDGFYRKITTYPDDPVWRQSIVRRSMVPIEGTGGGEAMGNYPAHMTAEQVADYLNIQVKTIRKWTGEGRIPHSKLGSMVRYKKEEIDAAIKDGSLKAKTREPKRQKRLSKVNRKSPGSS